MREREREERRKSEWMECLFKEAKWERRAPILRESEEHYARRSWGERVGEAEKRPYFSI